MARAALTVGSTVAAGAAGGYALSQVNKNQQQVAPADEHQSTSLEAKTRSERQARTKSKLPTLAEHISKLQRGNSVGGFPGFEPPDDDPKYKEKIRNASYNGHEANDWIGEINDRLGEIVKLNPNQSLEHILQQQGLSESNVNSFLDGIRNTHAIASGWEGSGVSTQNVTTLEALMKTLGVSPW